MACGVSCVLRHTFSVTAIQKGIRLPALQRLLGHDRLTITEIYFCDALWYESSIQW